MQYLKSKYDLEYPEKLVVVNNNNNNNIQWYNNISNQNMTIQSKFFDDFNPRKVPQQQEASNSKGLSTLEPTEQLKNKLEEINKLLKK